MKVTSVELRPEGSSDVINLSFRDPRSLNPYRVKSIAPLDADELTPQFYGTSGDSTKKYYDLKLKKREPVVLIGLNPRFGAPTESSYHELRDRLYRLISSSRTGIVKIVFLNEEDEVASLSGMVSKLEASLFTEKPEVQITFNCPDGMLRSIERTQSTAPVGPTNTLYVTTVKSTAPTGLRFEATIHAPTASFVMTPGNFEHAFDVRPHGGFINGDILCYSSEPNNKYLFIARYLTIIHVLDVLQPKSIWPILFPGENGFFTNVPVTWNDVDFYETYWGV